MEPIEIIERYYSPGDLRDLLLLHSRLVAEKALRCADEAGLECDRTFLYEAAMLHDIGIFRCDAPSILCVGEEPYIRHGVIGSQLLMEHGLPKHALVCERHTGSGLTAEEIEANHLPLPHRDMLPVSVEEKLICYADKFYSKSGDPRREKSIEQIISSMRRHGEKPLERFIALQNMFSKKL